MSAALVSVCGEAALAGSKWPPPAEALAAAGFDHLPFARNCQVHGNRVRIITDDMDADALAETPDADALITRRGDVALAVLVADCAPLFLADPVQRAVGLAHAGWRGTVADIAARAVEALGREYGSRPEDLVAWIGPCIKPRNYQVGAAVLHEVRQKLSHLPVEGCIHPGEKLDVAGLNRVSLLHRGLRDEHIAVSPLCSYEEPDLQSYRRDGDESGRMFALLTLPT